MTTSYAYRIAQDPDFNKKHYQKYKEKILAGCKVWAAENKDKIRANTAAWKINNKEKDREYQIAYRAAKRLLVPPPPPPAAPATPPPPSPDAVQLKITNLFVPGSVTLGQNDFL
jgi:hypothetical protein